MFYNVSLHVPFFSCCAPFLFNPTPTTEIYTLSLHDALPILALSPALDAVTKAVFQSWGPGRYDAYFNHDGKKDRKSTRLNSSHVEISYAVFCLKKKKNT